MTNRKVNILLSSYNGEKYIREFLDSALCQEGVQIDLLVRDDGSTDSTLQILDEYKEKGLLQWYKGENLKPARSFMALLKDSSDADYYAFADEDDYWKSEKMRVAVEKLQPFDDVPALYFSRTQLTDEKLNPIAGPIINPLLTFGESLVYEFIPGCTTVINRRLRNILNTYNPDYLPMHDVWVYSVALAVGAKIVFDKNSYILYRQHSSNTIGQGQGELHEWKRRFNRFINKEHSRSRRAVEIQKGFSQYMDNENKQILSIFIEGKSNCMKRLRLMNDKTFICGNRQTYKLFQLSVLLNIY